MEVHTAYGSVTRSYFQDSIWAGNTGTGGVEVHVEGSVVSIYGSGIQTFTGYDALIDIESSATVTGYGTAGN